MPAEPSSDELALSPQRISQATSKPIVLFKKPARYEEQHAAGPVRPIRIGARAIFGSTHIQKEGSKERIDRGWQWDATNEKEELQEEDEIEDY